MLHVPTGVALQPQGATGHCLPETSWNGNERQFPLLQSLRCIPKRFTDVFRLQIRISTQDLFFAHPIGHHRYDRCYGDAQTSQAGNTPHMMRIYCNPLESHHPSPLLGEVPVYYSPSLTHRQLLHFWHGDALQDLRDNIALGEPLHPQLRLQNQSVRKRRMSNGFHIIGDDVVTPFERRPRPRQL